ncbi:MAG: hypothetical protein ACI4FN_06060 [Acutalibacteraceae bacterium]
MNKKKLILTLTIILLTVLSIFGLYPFLGKKPFANINEADISSASVQLMPPNKTIVVIDGIGYRTKYEQCERLSQFANDLLQIKE